VRGLCEKLWGEKIKTGGGGRSLLLYEDFLRKGRGGEEPGCVCGWLRGRLVLFGYGHEPQQRPVKGGSRG